MTLLEILLIGIGLSMDAFAVAICKGLAMPDKVDRKGALLIALYFGVFQAVMPALGWLLGSQFARYVTQMAPWIAFVLLAWIGGSMIRESLSKEEKEEADEEMADTTEPADEPDIASDPNLRVIPDIYGQDKHCNMELRTALPSLHGEELEAAVAKLPDVFLELYPKRYVRVKFDPSKAPGSYPELIFKFATCPSEERIRVRMLEREPFRRAFCKLVTQICEHLHAGFERKAKYLCVALRDDVYGEGNK